MGCFRTVLALLLLQLSGADWTHSVTVVLQRLTDNERIIKKRILNTKGHVTSNVSLQALQTFMYEQKIYNERRNSNQRICQMNQQVSSLQFYRIY